MTTSLVQSEQHFVLESADWGTYESLLRAVGDRHVFVTYDRGRIELMAPSWEHDTRTEGLGQVVRLMAEALDLPLKGGGSPTFRREDLDRGLEPDKCFYISNHAKIRGKRKIDLSIDPPPDLCIEVEISRRLLDRIEIYADLGVPELWRDDGQHVRVFVLQSDRTYAQRSVSPTFPEVPIEQIERFLRWSRAMDDTSCARKIRSWLREHLGKA